MTQHSEAEPKRAYKSAEFQQRFGIGNTKMHAEIRAGRLRARYLGRVLLIAHEDALAWLNSLPTRDPKEAA